MVDLGFKVDGIEVERYALVPTLLFKIRASNLTTDVMVENILLQVQIRIETTRRRYSREEQLRLAELFGAPERWGDTLRSLLWTHVTAQVGAFGEDRVVDLPVPCSFDFNVAATKYFHGLESGEVPLTLLFSGTIFHRNEIGQLQMEQIAWSKEATCRLPVRLWREMMDRYYPGKTWLGIDREVFDEIDRYKRQKGCTCFDDALRTLLRHQHEEAAS